MNRVIKIDTEARTMMVEAGATWQEAAARAEAAGLFLPVVPHFAISSTIGGAIASSGIGIGAYKYGTARDLIVNLEVVLEDGRALQTGIDRYDLGGSHFDLGPLFWGSEGTFGIITRATLRLYPKPEEIRSLAYAFEDASAATPALRDLAASAVEPYHVALLSASHLELVKAVRFDAPEPAGIVLVVLEGSKDEVAEAAKVVDALMAENGAARASGETAAWAWNNRMYPYPTRRISGGLVVGEAIVPLSRFRDAVERTRALREAMKMEVGLHAILADRSSVALYPYFLDDETNPMPPARLGFLVRFRELVMDLEGHPMGVGLFLAFHAPAMHGNAYRYFRPLKEALDPHGRFNPGKVIEIGTRFGLPGLRRIPLSIAPIPLKVLGALKALTPLRDRFVQKYARRGSR